MLQIMHLNLIYVMIELQSNQAAYAGPEATTAAKTNDTSNRQTIQSQVVCKNITGHRLIKLEKN